jgi:UDP-N-acetylglucosamine 1-carboxyvinyltransferase
VVAGEDPGRLLELLHEGVVAWLEQPVALAGGADGDHAAHRIAEHTVAMAAIRISASGPLEGSVAVGGAKNSVLKLLAATLLAPGEYVLRNVPGIQDVTWMGEVLTGMGCTVDRAEPHTLRVVRPERIDPQAPYELVERMRASIVVLGPLLASEGRARVSMPGGDDFGSRPIDMHLRGLEALGARFGISHGYVEGETEGLVGTRIVLEYPSVGATENALMAAVLAEGETIVGHAACEPHIQDLCRFLVTLGAQIEGIGSNVLKITGVPSLGGGGYRIRSEHVEVASFAALAAVTGGEITIEDVEPDDLISIVPAFRKLGIQLDVRDSTVRVPPDQELRVVDDFGDQIPKIESGIWPAFPADLTSIAVVAATQAHGTVLVFEKMFESRLFFVDKLVSMGARIVLCDPHRVVVTGPAKLYGQRLESPDIRAGMAMVIAALCAEGRSTIGNVGQIDRGYETIDERLRGLGAQIERADL